jgi:NOL1/NOP2/fmu family ribosome biogenesis protein
MKKKITILPREPLTKKARSAIAQHVILEGNKKGNYFSVLIAACLAAERMRRADLYALLEKKGYRWKPKVGAWMESKAPDRSG